jgi:flavin reductase (DIM6/NTAB) family NADH-FMN oxidoreductase RutF
MHITTTELQSMSRFYRANIVNCISGAKPAMLCGTVDAAGVENLALFSNIFHLGADPALLGYVQRPIGESGDTFRNIEASGFYTFNFVQTEFLQQAHFASARFASGISEFEACALTPEYIGGFTAPFVAQSNIKIGLKLEQVIPIALNDTRIVLGSIQHIIVPDDLVGQDGNILLQQRALACVGLEQYYGLELVKKLSYAKVENLPSSFQ